MNNLRASRGWGVAIVGWWVVAAIMVHWPVGVARAESADPIPLNRPQIRPGMSVMQALQARASVRAWADKKLSHQDLSDLLWAANGVNRPGEGKRTAASAMNAQDIDIYVFTAEGVYLYDAPKHMLNPVAQGDLRAQSGTQGFVANAPVSLVLVSEFSRFKRGSEADKRHWAALDAGIVSQNIALFCATRKMGTVPRAGMDEKALRATLKLKETQHLMLNHPVGYLEK